MKPSTPLVIFLHPPTTRLRPPEPAVDHALACSITTRSRALVGEGSAPEVLIITYTYTNNEMILVFDEVLLLLCSIYNSSRSLLCVMPLVRTWYACTFMFVQQFAACMHACPMTPSSLRSHTLPVITFKSTYSSQSTGKHGHNRGTINTKAILYCLLDSCCLGSHSQSSEVSTSQHRRPQASTDDCSRHIIPFHHTRTYISLLVYSRTYIRQQKTNSHKQCHKQQFSCSRSLIYMRSYTFVR